MASFITYAACGCVQFLDWDTHSSCHKHLSPSHLGYLRDNISWPVDCSGCCDMSLAQRKVYVDMFSYVRKQREVGRQDGGPAGDNSVTASGSRSLESTPRQATAAKLTSTPVTSFGGGDELAVEGEYRGRWDIGQSEDPRGIESEKNSDSSDHEEEEEDLPSGQCVAEAKERVYSPNALLAQLLPAALKANDISIPAKEVDSGAERIFANLKSGQKTPDQVPLWPLVNQLKDLTEKFPQSGRKDAKKAAVISARVATLSLEDRPYPVPDALFRDAFPTVKRFASAQVKAPQLPSGPKRETERCLQDAWYSAARVASVLSIGGLVGTYVSALANPLGGDVHEQAVLGLGVDPEEIHAAFGNDSALMYLREISKCHNVIIACFLSAIPELFACSTAITMARRRMWLAEATACEAHKEFYMKREIVPGLLFSMNQTTMEELKRFVADSEALEKILKPKATTTTPGSAAVTRSSAENVGFAAFKQGFNKHWGRGGRGRGGRGRGAVKGRGSPNPAGQPPKKQGRGAGAPGSSG